MKYKAATG